MKGYARPAGSKLSQRWRRNGRGRAELRARGVCAAQLDARLASDAGVTKSHHVTDCAIRCARAAHSRLFVLATTVGHLLHQPLPICLGIRLA